MNKSDRLLALAKKRKVTTYKGYTAIGDYNSGAYECDYVSPYSISAHNVDADILIILQDWCSEENFKEEVRQETLKYGYTPSVKTNIKLKELLLKHLNVTLEQTYATNLFPYIKPGPMNASISAKDLLKAAKDFTLPIIEIINPRIAICFGKATFDAIRKACGLKAVKNIEEAIASHFTYQSTEIFCQAHTGQLGQNNRNRGGIERVSMDWQSMFPYFKKPYNNSLH